MQEAETTQTILMDDAVRPQQMKSSRSLFNWLLNS